MAFMKTNSVDITVGGTTYNSLDDFGLAIKNTDYIGTPFRDDHISYVPGRNGPLDYTYVYGEASFMYREISIEFGGLQEPEDWDTWVSTFRNLFEGKEVKLEFATDPGWYYSGRASIEDFEHKRAVGTFRLAINYAYPFKRKDIVVNIAASSEGTSETLNVTRETIIPEVTCAGSITIIYNGESFSFDAGTHKDPDFRLTAGTHPIVVTGLGAVTISYKDGSL